MASSITFCIPLIHLFKQRQVGNLTRLPNVVLMALLEPSHSHSGEDEA